MYDPILLSFIRANYGTHTRKLFYVISRPQLAIWGDIFLGICTLIWSNISTKKLVCNLVLLYFIHLEFAINLLY